MTDAEKLDAIRQWCDAYPVAAFAEPDMRQAHRLLQAGGMTLDAISASNFRYILRGIRRIIDGDDQP